VRELTGGEGVDVVIDSVGATWPDSLRCLRPGGRLAVFGATAGSTVELEARPIYFGQFSILGTTMGSPRDFAGLLRALEEGSWRPVIDSVRPLAEAAEAHRRMEAGEQFGKLVLATG
jgi:NADPH:quinone reductase-like Zn-dependent oxidoreductase